MRGWPTSIGLVLVSVTCAVLHPLQGRAETIPQVVVHRTSATCRDTNYKALAANDDFAGLLAWTRSCQIVFQATNDYQWLHRVAIGEIALGRYSHKYTRAAKVNPLHAELADPNFWIEDAGKIARTLARNKFDPELTRAITNAIADAEEYLRTAVPRRADNSGSSACLLDNRLPIEPSRNWSPEERQKLGEGTFVCAKAYNERPLAILASEYAVDVFEAAKQFAMTNRNPDDRTAVRGAYVAREFFERAAKDGVEYTDAMALNQNIIDTYADYDAEEARSTLVGLGVFAVAVYFAAGHLSFAAAPATESVTVDTVLTGEAYRQAQEAYWQELARRAAASMPATP